MTLKRKRSVPETASTSTGMLHEDSEAANPEPSAKRMYLPPSSSKIWRARAPLSKKNMIKYIPSLGRNLSDDDTSKLNERATISNTRVDEPTDNVPKKDISRPIPTEDQLQFRQAASLRDFVNMTNDDRRLNQEAVEHNHNMTKLERQNIEFHLRIIRQASDFDKAKAYIKKLEYNLESARAESKVFTPHQQTGASVTQPSAPGATPTSSNENPGPPEGAPDQTEARLHPFTKAVEAPVSRVEYHKIQGEIKEMSFQLARTESRLAKESKDRRELFEQMETAFRNSHTSLNMQQMALESKAEKTALEKALKTQQEQQSKIEALETCVTQYAVQVQEQKERIDTMQKSMYEQIQSEIQATISAMLPSLLNGGHQAPNPEEEEDPDDEEAGSDAESHDNDYQDDLDWANQDAANLISEDTTEALDRQPQSSPQDDDNTATGDDFLEHIPIHCDDEGNVIHMKHTKVRAEVRDHGNTLSGRRVQDQRSEDWFYISHIHEWSACPVIIITKCHISETTAGFDEEASADFIDVNLYAALPEVRIEAARLCLQGHVLDQFESRLSKLKNTPIDVVYDDQSLNLLLWEKAVGMLANDQSFHQQAEDWALDHDNTEAISIFRIGRPTSFGIEIHAEPLPPAGPVQSSLFDVPFAGRPVRPANDRARSGPPPGTPTGPAILRPNPIKGNLNLNSRQGSGDNKRRREDETDGVNDGNRRHKRQAYGTAPIQQRPQFPSRQPDRRDQRHNMSSGRGYRVPGGAYNGHGFQSGQKHHATQPRRQEHPAQTGRNGARPHDHGSGGHLASNRDRDIQMGDSTQTTTDYSDPYAKDRGAANAQRISRDVTNQRQTGPQQQRVGIISTAGSGHRKQKKRIDKPEDPESWKRRVKMEE